MCCGLKACSIEALRMNRGQQLIEAHNAEAHAVWESFNAGQPTRTPVFLGTSTQFFIFNDDLNPREAITFVQYCTDADTMLDFQLRAAVWRASHIAPYCDDPIGMPPDRHAWSVRVDLQNFDEAAHLGAPVLFGAGQVPDTPPILAGDRKNALFDAGMPDPLRGGWYKRAHEILECWQERLHREPEYAGWPVRIEPFGWWSGGPLTLAVSLRGHELLTDLYEDPEYVRTLLDFLTDVTIARVRAHARFFGMSDPPASLWFADDALQMISVRMARQFLLPVYRRLKAEMTTAEHLKVHLCGDATRHFRWLNEEVGVNDFETGFPVDHGRIRRDLGPDVTIHGGPTVMVLRDGSPEAVAAETQRILDSGVCEGGRFVLREANNLAPRTPSANLAAMYETARAWRAHA
jgi:uroporphyrinogen-III decarboxylase